MAKAPASSTPAPATPEAPAVFQAVAARQMLAPLLNLRKKPVRAALFGVPVAIIGGAALWYSAFFPARVQRRRHWSEHSRSSRPTNLPCSPHRAEVRTGEGESFANVGGSFFVLGAVMVEDAREHQTFRNGRRLYLIASRYLEESRIRGFPAGMKRRGCSARPVAPSRRPLSRECFPY